MRLDIAKSAARYMASSRKIKMGGGGVSLSMYARVEIAGDRVRAYSK